MPERPEVPTRPGAARRQLAHSLTQSTHCFKPNVDLDESNQPVHREQDQALHLVQLEARAGPINRTKPSTRTTSSLTMTLYTLSRRKELKITLS